MQDLRNVIHLRQGFGGQVRVLAAVLMAAMLIVGCGKKSSSVKAPAVPDNVVASVNDVMLTQEELDLEMKFRIAAIRPAPEGEKLAEMTSRMRHVVIEQFIVRTLLLSEAEKLGLEASEEERAQAMTKIKGNLPPGQTIESIVAASPLGEAGLRDEIITGIKINKLLETTLADQLVVTDEELTALMVEHKASLKRPERVRARHILLQFEPGDDEAAKVAKKAEIEKLHQELLNGADFAALAGEHSACASRQRGGDLGFFTRGRMAPPFEEAAFSQEIDAIGPVIETTFGYHIVQVAEKQAAGDATREEVTRMLKQRKQQTAMKAYIDELKGKAKITAKAAKAAPAS